MSLKTVFWTLTLAPKAAEVLYQVTKNLMESHSTQEEIDKYNAAIEKAQRKSEEMWENRKVGPSKKDPSTDPKARRSFRPREDNWTKAMRDAFNSVPKNPDVSKYGNATPGAGKPTGPGPQYGSPNTGNFPPNAGKLNTSKPAPKKATPPKASRPEEDDLQ